MNEHYLSPEGLYQTIRTKTPRQLRLTIGGYLCDLETPFLTPLERESFILGQDQSDIFVGAGQLHPEWAELRQAATLLSSEWLTKEIKTYEQNPRPIVELIWLCSNIHAIDSTPNIAKIAADNEAGKLRLPHEEDMQNFALRGLSSLLAIQSLKTKLQYKALFEKALNRSQHTLIGLTTLSKFWPHEINQFIKRSREQNHPNLELIINNLMK